MVILLLKGYFFNIYYHILLKTEKDGKQKMKKPIFIKNAVILTASSLILRVLGVVFKVWVAARVGGEGMGAYQLIISVYWLFCAFSQTGVSVAVTRLCADCISLSRDFRPVIKKAFLITLITALFSAAVMFSFSGTISNISIGNNSFETCFKILSLSIIPVGFSACFRGFFFAVRKASVSAFSQIFEQIIRIGVSFALVVRFSKYGIVASCIALSLGDCISETVCALHLYLSYRKRAKKLICGAAPYVCGMRQVLRISFPLTAGRYISLALRTAESIMVPKGLSKSGMGAKASLEIFGNIKAMALPVLLFPSGFFSAISSLLVPEISAAGAKGHRLVVKELCGRIINLTLIISIIFACQFAFCGRQIGMLLYKTNSVGVLLCLLAPLLPLMFIDVVCDGLLKGLDCQRFSFFCGVSDSALRLFGVLILLPRYGATGFIFVMYFSNIYTAALNITMLFKKSDCSINTTKSIFLPLCIGIIITKGLSLVLPALTKDNLIFICLFFSISTLAYFGGLFLTKCISPYEIKDAVTP